MTPVDRADRRAAVTRMLAGAGCVAPDDEADELLTAAPDDRSLDRMVARRMTGEPLAWITGHATFCGLDITVDPGTYVPRWQSEALARRAARLLPTDGTGVDLCTGTGAVGLVMRSARPGARVVGTESDPAAARCARRNGLVVLEGDLDEPLPGAWVGQVDVMTGVVPYVPEEALHLLPRDVQAFEPAGALNGGKGGLEVVARAVAAGHRWLRPGGWLLLEIGGDQSAGVRALLTGSGFTGIGTITDPDGDPRGVVARLTRPSVGG